MGKRVTVRETARLTGLSIHELRIGAKNHRYPCLMVGGTNKKQLFDIDELENFIHQSSMENVIQELPEPNSKIRRIEE
jgi:hypothetical protein